MDELEVSQSRNPADYLKIFFRRKWLIIAPAFVGLVLGIVAAFLLPPEYESYTVILVQEEKSLNPLMQGLAVSTSVADRMKTIKEQLLGWNSLVSLTQKLNLDKRAENQGQFEALVLGLRRNIDVSVKGANLIRISYSGKNPKETQLVAKTMTDILLEENMKAQTKETDVAIGFIKDQLELYKRKIKESEISDLEDQLKRLLVDSTEEHPLVKELRYKIAVAKKELASGDYEMPKSSKPADEQTATLIKSELDKLTGGTSAAAMSAADPRAPPSDPNTSIYKMMLMDKLDSVLARDMQVNENIYNMLLQKLETAKITQRLEASKQGTRYTIIDPPRLPLQPSKPNKPLVIFISFFLGCALGIGCVFGREFMDKSFLDIEDAKNSLELPVLGGISRLTTQEEIDKEKSKQKVLITIGLGSALVVIIAAMLFYFLRK